jgi:IclR family acetate operon transcriptional repressor
VGPAIWRLFRHYDWSTLVSFCRPQLKALANKTGETAHLAVRQGKQTLFIDHQSSSNQIIAVSGQTGEFKPLYCTAHGKALLADVGLAAMKAMFPTEPLTQYTPQTIMSVAELARACGEIKSLGYTMDDSEFEEQVRCLAAPIRDGDGAIIASIGISAPVARLQGEQLEEAARQVAAVAREITEDLSADGS